VTASVSIPRSVYNALRSRAGRRPKYIETLHPKQRAFVEDQSKRKTALCGRRGGKTHGIGCWLLDGCEKKPRAKSLYVALTRAKAKSVLWDDCLEPLSRRFDLGLRLVHDEGALYIVHPNGHRIWLLGVDKQSEVDKVRGEKLWRVVIDEAQAFGEHMAELVEQAIEWALMDYDGQMALTGTPNPDATGYFWAATTGLDPNFAKWPVFTWTVLDNPAIPHAAEWLTETMARNKWDEKHPTYRREFLGEWTEDRGALIYPIAYDANGWTPGRYDVGELSDQPLPEPTPFGLPPGKYQFGLGVDIGFSENSTAFCLAANLVGSGRIYLLKSYTLSRVIPTQLAAQVQAIRENIKTLTGQGLRVVVDEGALGKGYAEQMRVMGVGCEAAQKTEKRAYQDFVRGLILNGSVRVHMGQCAELVDETRKLQFDPETNLEDERYKRHCCDAMLYIVRAMVPRYVPERNPPKPGSKEALRAEMAALKQKTVSDREKRQRRVLE
jgi:hypothetical protein